MRGELHVSGKFVPMGCIWNFPYLVASINTTNFSSVVDHVWCRVSSVCANDVSHRDTLIMYRFYARP